MAKDPAFLFYSNDFISGTQFLTDEQVGIYIRLLCAQHQHGRLTEKQVNFICKTHDDEVLLKFKRDDEGLLYNERLEIEINRRKLYSESRANNRKHKDNKPVKPKKDMKNISNTYENHMETENETVIEYLNTVCGTKFKTTSEKTKTLIKARLAEKFTIEDFKTVIDKKFNDWGKDVKMSTYLRPETLFGTKFESYLNQKTITESKVYHQEPNKDYSEKL